MARIVKARCLTLALIAGGAGFALAQQCPRTSESEPSAPSEVQTLAGHLIYHDGIRKWFELKLDQAQCGQSSIELLPMKDDWKPIEIHRGCRVRSTGSLDLATTGYYSLDVAQGVQQIEALGECDLKEPLPDYSKVRPDRSIRAYRVDMELDYDPLNKPIHFRVTQCGKELQPWQAYASYMLTGGFVLYGMCGDGFMVDRVFGTPEASPSHFNGRGEGGDTAMFDPEGAAAAGKKDLHLVYTCIREPRPHSHHIRPTTGLRQ